MTTGDSPNSHACRSCEEIMKSEVPPGQLQIGKPGEDPVADSIMEYFQLFGFPPAHARPSVVAAEMSQFIKDRMKVVG